MSSIFYECQLLIVRYSSNPTLPIICAPSFVDDCRADRSARRNGGRTVATRSRGMARRGRPSRAPSGSQGFGRGRQGRTALRRGSRPSRTSLALKNRRLRFTATAQEHVRREKAWWWANRDHTDVFTEEVEQALRIIAALPGAGTPYPQSPVPGVRRVYLTVMPLRPQSSA